MSICCSGSPSLCCIVFCCYSVYDALHSWLHKLIDWLIDWLSACLACVTVTKTEEPEQHWVTVFTLHNATCCRAASSVTVPNTVSLCVSVCVCGRSGDVPEREDRWISVLWSDVPIHQTVSVVSDHPRYRSAHAQAALHHRRQSAANSSEPVMHIDRRRHHHSSAVLRPTRVHGTALHVQCLLADTTAALHRGAPWLEDPPPWLKPWLRPA